MFEVDEDNYEPQHVIPGKGTETDDDMPTFGEHLAAGQLDSDDEDDENSGDDSEDETPLRPLI